MTALFMDRRDAGQQLAGALEKFRAEKPVILALPRGGLPIGYEIAKALQVPLDILLVRKIGTPGAPELAAGAIVDGDDPQLVLNDEVVGLYGVPKDYIARCKAEKLEEIKRRCELYRADHPPVDVRDKTVIVVDDGIATGATVRAALKGLQKRGPKKLILAVPVAPPETLKKLSQETDEAICLETPENFWAISMHYGAFPQVSDEEVVDILKQADTLSQRGTDTPHDGKHRQTAA